MKVSVIIPVYKVEEYLDKCVQSVVNQTYKDLEIILVDDGSPDKCPQMCDEWARKDSRIRVVHKKNGGLSSARNAGIDAATGNYIGFIDSDDWIDIGMYELLLSGFDNESIGVTSCGVMTVRGDVVAPFDRKWLHEGKRLISYKDFAIKLLPTDVNFTVVSKLYKRELFKTLRFREGKKNEDSLFIFDLSKVLVDKQVDMQEMPKACYYYFIRNESICNDASHPLIIDVIENFEDMAIDARSFDKGLSDILMDYRNQQLYPFLYQILGHESLRNQFSKYHKKFKSVSSLRFIKKSKLSWRSIISFLLMKYYPKYFVSKIHPN